MDPETAGGDHPEGALAPHEELGEVGTGRRPRAAPSGADHAAVGEDDLEAEHHVLDLPVPVGVLARTPAGQPTADRREVHRLGPVPEGHPVLPAQPRLDVGTEGPGPQVGDERVGVDRTDAGEAAEVEGDPAEDGDRGTAHPAAPAGRGHRHPGRVAEGQHVGDLRGLGRTGHQRRPAGHRTLCRPPDGQRPPVAPGLGPVLVQDRDLGARIRQPPGEVVVDLHPGAGQPVGRPGRLQRRSP